jgi:hypothetical protein
MNAMLSNLSHDLDVSLAYIIDKKVGGTRTGISALCIRSEFDGTTSTLAAYSPMRSGSLSLFGERCDGRGAHDDSAHSPLSRFR